VSRFAPALFAVFATAAVAALPAACSSQEQLQGEGGPCTQATDCQEGLVCIPQPDGTRTCSSDLGSIQQTEDAGGGGNDAAPKDSGNADARMPARDGGTPPQDGGAPPQDSGSPPQDSGSPPQDGGSPPQDSGAPPQDSGGGTDAAAG
jgi:hypothetical protein